MARRGWLAGAGIRADRAGARSRVHQETRLETRMDTRTGFLARGASQAEAVLGRLNRLIWRQLPDFAATTVERPASTALAASDRPGAAGHCAAPVGGGFCRADGFGRRRSGADQHAGDARGTAPAQDRAQAGGGDAGRAGDDRGRRAAVPEPADRGAAAGDGARLVRAPADAGAAGGGQRTRLLRRGRSSGAPPDRPHGCLRDGFRRHAEQGRRVARTRDQADRPGRRGLSGYRAPGLPDGAERIREVSAELLRATRTRPAARASRWPSRSSSARRWRSSTPSSCARC